MTEEKRYREEIMKKEFKKNFVRTKRDLFHKTGNLLIEFVKLISNLISKFILCFTT